MLMVCMAYMHGSTPNTSKGHRVMETPQVTQHGAPDEAARFADWLDAMRAKSDLSWAEVARRSGVSETGLRKIRQGEATPRPATMDALASAFSDAHPDTLGGVFSSDFVPLPPMPAARGEATVWVTVPVTAPRAGSMNHDTVTRLVVFLQHSARAWLVTTDCPERD